MHGIKCSDLPENTQILNLFRKKLLIRDVHSDSYQCQWSSPSNIALVKYWGKYGNQLPMNPSLSITLEKSQTLTRLQAIRCKDKGKIHVDFLFHGLENELFRAKIQNYFESISLYCPYLRQFEFKIESENTFPHSAGIASSASSMSALALCITSLENYYFKLWEKPVEFNLRASWLARLASGSASRSIFSDFGLWGKSELFAHSSNYYAIHADINVHESFSNLHDAVLIVDKSAKKHSSRAGHQLMMHHPFRNARKRQAHKNLELITASMISGDWNVFTEVVENEAFTLHGLMMSSKSSFTLMQPSTLYFVEEIRRIREQNKLNICFTLDAGPNLHVIYEGKQKQKVLQLLSPLIEKYDGLQWIDDKVGKGPVKLN